MDYEYIHTLVTLFKNTLVRNCTYFHMGVGVSVIHVVYNLSRRNIDNTIKCIHYIFIDLREDLDKIDENSLRPAFVACLVTTPSMPDRILQSIFVVSFR